MSTRNTPHHKVGNDIFMLERNAYINTLAQDVIRLFQESRAPSQQPAKPKRLRNYQKLIPNVLTRSKVMPDRQLINSKIAQLHSFKGLCKLMHYQPHRINQLNALLSDSATGSKELPEIEQVILRFTRVFPACIPGTSLQTRR